MRLGIAAVLLASVPLPARAEPKLLGYETLVQFLEDPARPLSAYRLIQASTAERPVGVAHDQYNNVCWLFSMQAAADYLGYSLQERGAHYLVWVDDYRGYVDTGYWGSPEFLLAGLANYAHDNESIDLGSSYDDHMSSRTDCSVLDCAGEPEGRQPSYGACADQATFWSGFCTIGDDPTIVEDAWAYLEDETVLGCNDYRNFGFSEARITDFRKIIKAFVDHNAPLVVNVACHHNNVVIGYADIAADGLPDTAITAEVNIQNCTGERAYKIFERLSDPASWAESGNYFSICRLRPWCHHLAGGCDPGGWAAELDADIDLELCRISSGDPPFCNQGDPDVRYYGIHVDCWNGGALERSFFARKENPFVTVDDEVSCDRLEARFADGGDSSAVGARWTTHGYSPAQGRWLPIATHDGIVANRTMKGRLGVQVSARFDPPGAERLAAARIAASDYSQRRSTLVVDFDAGESLYVEIAPPGTYGVRVTCSRDDGTADVFFAEADHGKSHHYTRGDGALFLAEKQFLMEPDHRACDSLELSLALGDASGRLSVTAELSRYGYRAAGGAWIQLNAPWWPDRLASASPGQTGLSGNVNAFTWDETWRDGDILAADGLAGEIASRQTVIELRFGDGTRRSLVVAPY
ncbi:MAG: hypothetical protein JXR96_09400 [Deltaproteobacteria bacterium]|nr:hypothetical protein [Deltaproteobacteria bacterium]